MSLLNQNNTLCWYPLIVVCQVQRGLTPAKGLLEDQLGDPRHPASRTVRLMHASDFFHESEVVVVSLVRSGRSHGTCAANGAVGVRTEHAKATGGSAAHAAMDGGARSEAVSARMAEGPPEWVEEVLFPPAGTLSNGRLENAQDGRHVLEQGGCEGGSEGNRAEALWPLGDAGWVRKVISRAKSRLVVVGHEAAVQGAQDENGLRPWEAVLPNMTALQCHLRAVGGCEAEKEGRVAEAE
jgi:hypothetical protein